MNKVSNTQPKRLLTLINEGLAELKSQNEELTRLEKCSIIGDIFRTKKLSSIFNPQHLVDINENWWETFCKYYDMSITDLDIELASLSMYLSRYMRQQVEAHNNGWVHFGFDTGKGNNRNSLDNNNFK